MALNLFCVADALTHVYLRQKTGNLLICEIDTTDIPLVLGEDRPWVPKWNPTARTF